MVVATPLTSSMLTFNKPLSVFTLFHARIGVTVPGTGSRRIYRSLT